MTCTKCNTEGSNLKKVDIPKDANLCNTCYEEFIWKCDSCSKIIAYPDVEGGEYEGFTPLEFESWCRGCCSERLAECDSCRSDDLKEDMKSTPDGLLCESCTTRIGLPPIDDSPVLTKDNWRDAALNAISLLPETIQASIGSSLVSDNKIRVSIAGEPIPSDEDDHSESSISYVEVVFREAQQNQGSSPEQDEPYDFIDIGIEQAECSQVSVEGEATVMWRNFNIGRSKASALQGELQVAILEEMYCGGGSSMITKDRKGRYTHFGGKRILDWQ